MKSLTSALALSLACLVVGEAHAIDRMVSGFPDLPKDAAAVAERSLGCQHFWGEVSGTGDERDQEVAGRLKELKCGRIEKDLEKVRAKYRKNPELLKILDEAALQ